MQTAIWDEFNFQFRKGFCIVRAVLYSVQGSLARDKRSHCIRRFWLTCALLFAAVSAPALDVAQVKWGFDGRVVPNRFNIVSVLLANSSPEPFDGVVTFYKNRGLAERVGAIYQTSCYVSPRMTRWVQFYVYTDSPYDQWHLEWGRGANDFRDLKEDDAPKWGAPAQVLLSDSDTTVSITSVFKQFPDALFPATVAATGGLGSLLMDYAPRWEPAKRQAFVNWLRTGGEVHVFQGADGQYPIFPEELSVLNISTNRARVGAGVVVRHATTVHNIRKQDIKDDVPLKQVKPDEPSISSQISDSFFRALAGLSRPQYNWALIFMLAILYVAVVGPGNLVAGKKLADYRLRVGLLLGTIAGFAVVFNLVGRHGQGEANVIHTLSYARMIDGDRYKVTQWINPFATKGAHYTIQHSAPHNIYTTGQDYESVNGMIENGKDGRFVVDMPMFSRRALLHEGEMKGPAIPVQVTSWDTGTAKQVALTVGPDFTKEIVDGWLVRGGHIYTMKLTDGRLEFNDSGSRSVSSLPLVNDQQPVYMRQRGYDSDVVDEAGVFKKLAEPLIGWSLSTEDFTANRAADDRAELYLFARSPRSFGVTGSQFPREIGYVLYHLNVFKPGS